MVNVLDAIDTISRLKSLALDDLAIQNNRVIHVGDGLEAFVKDAFADTFDENDKQVKREKYSEVFSYQGSVRTPPDLMIRDSDAIEVKKVESLTSELQLNSSHPKARLFSDSTLINNHCKTCETWTEKDFIYAIGHISKGTKALSSLWFIQGSIYAADEAVYLSLKKAISDAVEETPDVDFSVTKELGRVNRVDPLNITHLRVRGMWLLQQPYKVFDYVHGYDKSKNFQCITLIMKEKYDSFSEQSKQKITNNNSVTLKSVQIFDPNNPSKKIDCVLITYSI